MIDWEEHLSHIIGDVLTHRLTNGLHRIYRHARYTAQSFEKNLTQYLQEEAELLPTREALEDFYKDVEQLHARVNQLEKKWCK